MPCQEDRTIGKLEIVTCVFLQLHARKASWHTMYVAKYAEKWLFAYLIQFFILGSGPSW